ncbi:MAG: hypothetical protein Q8J68_02665 [Methanolobus sp.]|nr:hypothetical protein [Methanolobus sp.]MDP2216177.1 hypothetical protein [Methanolobus sp.]
MSNTHEWCAADVSPEIDNLKGLPCDLYSWWMQKNRVFLDRTRS